MTTLPSDSTKSMTSQSPLLTEIEGSQEVCTAISAAAQLMQTPGGLRLYPVVDRLVRNP